MAHLQLRGVRKDFGTVQALDDINLDVSDGEFAVFVGPSGCGKSTLLRAIAGLEDVTSGTIRINDVDVTHVDPADRGVAMVFQSYALYPHMSVRDNMAFGLKMAGMKKSEIKARIARAASILRIGDLLDRKPRQLSGGQRQRVAIGRAIVREPRIFLFDEPLSNLDASLRVEMRTELAKLHNDLGATMVYVTHDQVEAMTMADRIIVLNGGRVEQIGSPLELYRSPANRFVAGFIGSPKMNFVEVTIADADAEGATVLLPGETRLKLPVRPDGLSAGDGAVLGARPEHLDGRGEGDVQIAGEVLVVERLGAETLAYVRTLGDHEVLVSGPGEWPIKLGERLNIGVTARLCHLFHPAGDAFRPMA